MNGQEKIKALTISSSSLKNFNIARKKMESETGLKISNSQVIDSLTLNLKNPENKDIFINLIGDDSIFLTQPLKSMLSYVMRHNGTVELIVDEMTLKSKIFAIIEETLGFKEALVFKIHFNLIPEFSNLDHARLFQMFRVNRPEFFIKVSTSKMRAHLSKDKLIELVRLNDLH